MNFANITEWRIPEGDVIRVTDGQNRVIWEKKTEPDYTEPFYVENITNSTETLNISKNDSRAPSISIEYSLNRTNWYSLGTTSTTAITRTLNPGDKIYLRANATRWGTLSPTLRVNKITGVSKVGGNIMSLLYGSSFNGNERDFPQSKWYVFVHLFISSTLISSDKLLLPATQLTQYCYCGLFDGCSSLVNTPELPASTLAENCYEAMFRNCAITTAPDLNADSFVIGCYSYMFYNCVNLTYVKCLGTNTETENCRVNWLSNVSSTGTFTKAAGITWPTGDSGIPSGWTVNEQ